MCKLTEKHNEVFLRAALNQATAVRSKFVA